MLRERMWILFILLQLLHPLRMAIPSCSGEPFMPAKSNYTRFSELRERCSVLHNPHPINFNKWNIKNELQFSNGDWRQQAGTSPLMPFLDPHLPFYVQPEQKDPLRLATLWITDIDLLQQGDHLCYKPNQPLNVSAILELGMSSQRTVPIMEIGPQGFRMKPGFSLLTLHMEGVYAELPNGQRQLCLLGCTQIPIRGKNASNPWSSTQPDVSPELRYDCQIIANIQFPAQLSLSTRAVTGTITSLHPLGSDVYFDAIELESQLGPNSNYKFESSYPVNLNPALPADLVYRGENFCAVFMELVTPYMDMTVLPNWKCPLSSSQAECTRLGPLMNGGINITRLFLQDIRCVDLDRENDRANVSAVLRAVLPSQSLMMARDRTGLDNLTLALEGQWSKESGQLSMIGCTSSHNHSSSCHTRITMYIPQRLSLKQRGVLLGSITSSLNGSSFYPLSFQMPLYLANLPVKLRKNMSYEFTKMKEAGALRERDKPVWFGNGMKKSLFHYPSLNLNAINQEGYMDLARDISFLSGVIVASPDGEKDPQWLRHSIQLDIIAVEDYFQPYRLHVSYPYDSVEQENSSNYEAAEPKEFLRFAGSVKIGGDVTAKSLWDFSVEGNYDPVVGRMYLIGCREVQVPWKDLNEIPKLLDEGFDCKLSMRVQFPPLNFQWLANPTAKLSIMSERSEDDPLYFSTMELETDTLMYWADVVFLRVRLEGVLSLLTLSLMIACIVLQLRYIQCHIESIPYISQVALAILVVGYSLPLLSGAKSLFGIESSAIMNRESNGTYIIITFMINALSLVAFLLTLRMVQKVYKSRIRMLTIQLFEHGKAPNDRIVLCICSGIHLLSFAVMSLVHIIWMRSHQRNSYHYMDSPQRQWDWQRDLRQYFGLVQDLFLLPQVIGNLIWKSGKGKVALRKLFYMGVTTLRLLPHIYDRVRPSAFSPYYTDEYQYANPKSDFYSTAGDIAISVFIVLLAIAVYIQQESWNRVEYWGNILNWGSIGLLYNRVRSNKMHERLPYQAMESEMVESKNGLKDLKDEDAYDGHGTVSKTVQW